MRGPRGPHRHRGDGAPGGGGVHRSRSQKARAAEAQSQAQGKPARQPATRRLPVTKPAPPQKKVRLGFGDSGFEAESSFPVTEPLPPCHLQKQGGEGEGGGDK